MAEAPDSTKMEWLQKAEDDLEVARDLQQQGHGEPAAFYSQQAAEKALKAVQIHRQSTFERTHDLSRLARLVKAPRNVEEHAAILSPFYTATRYPDVGGGVSEEEAAHAVRRAEEVVAWYRNQIL